MKQFQILFLLFLSGLLASCNQGTDTTLNTSGGNAGMWTIPGVGTTYIYSNSQQGFDTLTVLRNRQHLGGKTNVVVLQVDFEGDTGIYNYESNGDFSFGESRSTDSLGNPLPTPTYTWTTLPVGSRSTISGPNLDTFEGNEHLVESLVRSFVGTEEVTVPAGQFSSLHERVTQIDDQISRNDSLGFSSTDTTITDFWFAPSIGLYVKVLDNQTNNGQIEQNDESDLIKYSPK